MAAPVVAAWIVALFSRYVMIKAGMWVASILAFFGLQFVATEYAIDPLIAQIQAIGSGLPTVAANWFAFFNVDRYVTIILSAYTVGEARRFALRKIGA